MSRNKLQMRPLMQLRRVSSAVFTVLIAAAAATPLLAADSAVQTERSLGQQYLTVLPVLVFILLLIVGLAFLVKKFNPMIGRGTPMMRVLGTLPLGGKERLILVQTGDACLLLGVTPAQIQTLHVVNKDSLNGAADVEPSNTPAAGFAGIFQAVLKR